MNIPKIKFRIILCIVPALLILSSAVFSHHYKGLPHYSYFENYPQVPVEEFLGQIGEYELSLVIYDFQGLKRSEVEQPDDIRLFLIIFNLYDNRVYSGPVTLQILDGSKIIYSEDIDAPEEENIYRLNQKLPSSGDFSLSVILRDEENLKTSIPFQLSSQKISWGKWIALALIIMVAVTAAGSRRARILLDRKKNMETQNH